MGIENVIIFGLGAIGLTYANKLKDVCELRILADNMRVEKYKNNTPTLNNKKIFLDYITPTDNFDADLIIICTKNSGLDSAIKSIKNFVKENTIIISLINGISSEEKIIEAYGKEHVLYSYFIGHSAVRNNHLVAQDGVGKIVFGFPNNENLSLINDLKEFFEQNYIDYEIPDDIIRALWIKLGVNIFLNQPSAILGFTMGEMKRNPNFMSFAKKLVREVKLVAEKCGIKNLENYEDEVLSSINLMSDDGKSSMLQDIEAGKKTEVDIFAGEIIKRAKIFNIETPCNQVLYDIIKIKEEN